MSRISQLRSLGLFDARVPRYTSYPTAMHFSERVTAASTRDWIAALEPGSRVSVYAHVPFCRRLCWFCACRTQGTSTLSPVEGYVNTLLQEIDLVAEHLPEGVQIENLHWGGGTPTLLSADLIDRLANKIRSAFPFASDAQFSVEIDPNEVDDKRLDALVAAGMNRASIGVQDFDPDIQATIGRIQGYELTRDVVKMIRARGVKSLNVDLLYGLPGQTQKKMTDSVQKVASLRPDRVALYGYAHVPWMAKRQSLIPTSELPSPEERLELFETSRNLFAGAGYDEIGIDHFALPGDSMAIAQKSGNLRRNFQGYTVDRSQNLIGLGASAISRFEGGYAQNDASTSGYQTRVRNGQLATSRGHRFIGDDLVRGRLIEALMCDFGFGYSRISRETDIPAARLHQITSGLVQMFPGMLVDTQDAMQILPQGKPLARIIARALDVYEMSETAHSHAV